MSMNKVISVSTMLVCLAVILLSCKKDSKEVIERIEINVMLRANQIYEYNLGAFGDEEGVSVFRQASHFIVSAAEMEVATGIVTYTYQPATNYVGCDEVELVSAKGSDGASANNRKLFTTIKFTVTN